MFYKQHFTNIYAQHVHRHANTVMLLCTVSGATRVPICAIRVWWVVGGGG